MKIYHQCGHNTNWNIDSFQKDKVGNGLILSPVHSSAEQVAKIPQDLKKTSLFDPQFYVPDSQKNKLNSYDFFPERVMEGFSTRDYEAFSAKVAGMCVDYQVENNFEAMISNNFAGDDRKQKCDVRTKNCRRWSNKVFV